MEFKILAIITVAITLMMGGTSGLAFASGDDDMSNEDRYQSGYNHGCSDARISDPSDRYINQDEKGFSYHTASFNDGYRDGFSQCGGNTVLIDKSDDHSNEQEQNQAAYTHQNGSCGVVLIGDCNVGQSSRNNFAQNAEN